MYVFGLLEELRKRAEAILDSVSAGLRIENVDGLRRAATTQLSMLGKMASIVEQAEDGAGVPAGDHHV